MNTEERLAQINEVSQRILNMPEAERQAYINQYGDAINEMLNEYQELRRPRQSMGKDPITERTPEQQAALSGDQPTQGIPRQRRRRQDRRQDTPETETPTEENVGPVIVRTNTDGTVSDDKGNNYIVDKDGNIVGSAAGTGSQADTTGTGSNVVTPKGSSDNSGADAPMWPLYGLLGLGIGGTYGAIKGLNSKNKVNTDWIKQRMSKPMVAEPVEGYHTPVKTAAETVVENKPKTDLIKQRMSTPMVSESVEGYHTPVKTAVENAAEKGVKNAVKKGAKNATLNAIEKGAKKALPSFLKKIIL